MSGRSLPPRRTGITILEAATVVTALAMYLVTMRKELAPLLAVPPIAFVVALLVIHGERYVRFLEQRALSLESRYGIYVYGRDKVSTIILLTFVFVSTVDLALIYLDLLPPVSFPIVVTGSILLAAFIVPFALLRAKALSSMLSSEVPLLIMFLKLYADASIPFPRAIELLESRVLSATSTLVKVCRKLANVSFLRIEDVFLQRVYTYSRRMFDYVRAMYEEYEEYGTYRNSVDSFYRATRLDLESSLKSLQSLVRAVSELVPESQTILLTIVGTMYIFYPVSTIEILTCLVIVPALLAVVMAVVCQVTLPSIARTRPATMREKAVLGATAVMVPLAAFYALIVGEGSPKSIALAFVFVGLPSMILLPRYASMVTGRHSRRVKEQLRRVHDTVSMGRFVEDEIRVLNAVTNESLTLDVFAREAASKVVEHGYTPSQATATLLEVYDVVSTNVVAVWRQSLHAFVFSALTLGTTILIYAIGYMMHELMTKYSRYAMGISVSPAFFEGLEYTVALLPFLTYFSSAASVGFFYALPYLAISGAISYLALEHLRTLTQMLVAFVTG